MPEFILNTPRSRTHPFYALSRFEKAYVEAMFFTDCDTGHDALHLEVERLTRASIKAIRRDCNKFLSTLLPDGRFIQQVVDFVILHGERDEVGIAHDLWFTRQGHGVGFWEGESRGYPSDTGEQLDEIAKGMGEIYPEVYRGWIHV